MTPYILHINLYDAAFFGTLFIGFTFIVLLGFTGKVNRAANRFLAMALLVAVLWTGRILAIDIDLAYYLPLWNRLPLQFSLAFGPLIYFYVLQITRPEYHFRNTNLLHFSPLLIELLARAVVFKLLNPVLQVLAFVSVSIYLHRCFALIKGFYKRQEFIDGDRYRCGLRWLRNSLTIFGALWLLWIPVTIADYGFYHHPLSIQAYYPLYLLLMLMIIYIAARAHLKTEIGAENGVPVLKQLPPDDLKQKGRWLKKLIKDKRYYEDPELSLTSLAEKLGLTVHELSRIINTALKKNFHDFINEYRVRDVARKIQDPAYGHITLLGIAYDSGFNSKTSFHRIFRQMTGKSPAEYKTELRKEGPSYKLEPRSRTARLVLSHETLPKWSHEKSNRNFMFKNYLKVAWRNLLKNKAHTFINVAGLSVGLACSLLILLWVQNERSIDAFHKNSDRLFEVYQIVHNNGQIEGMYDTPGILADELKKSVPEVQYATGMGFGELSTFQVGDKVLKLSGNSAGPDYFKMFSCPLLEGTAQAALNTPSGIAISRKMAVEFYGSPENAIGKTIRYQNSKNFTVTAVFENLPKNVSVTFDFLTNWYTFLDNNPWARNMGNVGPVTFVMLRKNADATLADKKIRNFYDAYFPGRTKGPFYADLALQPYAESYLHNDLSGGKPSGGRIETVRLFSIVAIFILLIACINFMNLTTARSVKRAREVGVRKAVGALRSSLIQQFIGESLMITAVAVAVSLLLVILLLPVFNEVTQKQFGLPFNQWPFWAVLIAITLVTGLISGSYPALFLSSLNPVKVLKGTLKLNTGTTMFRKGLVVFQFVLSAVLITGTVVISKQMHYIMSKNLGYDKDNLIYMPTEGELGPKYQLFKQELLARPDIEAVSRINTTPQDIYGSTGAVGWIGKDTTRADMFTVVSVGYDFMKTMKLKLAAGRDFSRDYPTDTSNFILNETAVKATGYKDPIGKPFRLFRKSGIIIGVVKDFNFHSMNTAIGPMVFYGGENDAAQILIRMKPGKTHEALTAIGQLCKQINPAFPPAWYFVDRQYQKMYQNEQVLNKLADAFSFLAIFISCLGLLGLAMFTAEQRLKEISIRKVLGAGISSLFTLLSREFIILVSIAFVLAIPVSLYAMNKWLANYIYHTPLQWWMFALSAGLILLIALATISFQVIKAALVNPVKSLRSE
ncbi:MAG: ABC transporter permease [Bacteroidetes bacterium]|nr:ABC transporter permease [Bacteroidota bacterium]